MYRNHTIGVVVPAYNEAGFVGDVARDLPAFVDVVYLVDDASTDGTWREMGEVLEAQEQGDSAATSRGAATAGIAQSQAPAVQSTAVRNRISDSETVGKLTRLRHGENLGAGGAVKTGYLAALESDVDVIATIDGDGQMDSARLPALLDPVVEGHAGYAKGNRFAGIDVVREMPPFRLFGNVLLTGLTRIATGYWRLSDPQNGFTAISQPALSAVDVEGFREYYGYMNQLLAQLNVGGVRIADVPIPATYGDEESSIEYRQYVRRVSALLLVSFVRRLREKYVQQRQYPVPVGYAVGALVAFGAVVRGLLSVLSDGETASPSDAVRAVAFGVALCLVAAVLDWAAEPGTVATESAAFGHPPGGNDAD